MVQFGTGYFNPMDREYGPHDILHGSVGSSDNATNDVGVSIGDFGVSLGLGPVPNIAGVGAKLRGGAKTMELVFTGSGKGSGQGHTPEMYGKKQRQAFREMQAANRVDFTTHATVGVYGLAGMDNQGNFSKQNRSMAVNEIKRAIDFAADVGQGGPVVVHTGEYQRPIVDAEWNGLDKEWEGKFKMYDDEPERASYRVVDTRTGGLIQEARKNRKVSRQVWNRYETGNQIWDEQGGRTFQDKHGKTIKPGDYIDYFGNRLDIEQRVPKFDPVSGTFMTWQMSWDDLKSEAQEMTERAKEVWRDWKAGKITEEEFNRSNWVRFKDIENPEKIKVKPEEAYIISTLETNASNSRGWAYYYGGSHDDHIKEMKKLQLAYEFYDQMEKTMDPKEKWRLKQQARDLVPGLVPDDALFPSELIKKAIRGVDRQMRQSQEASASQWTQAAETMETIRYVESAETYAVKEAVDAYAQAAIRAMENSKRLQQEGKLKKPIVVAMENLFPETYGAHPEELINLVEGTRDKVTKMLHQRGMPVQEAQEKAKQHVTATLDLGHLNMWRKYWQGDHTKTMEENDQMFNKWMLAKVEKMMDAGIIGHIHIDDNYGYQDDHLAPGEGNAPIRELVALVKKKGYKGEMIVEPGADYYTDLSASHTLMKTWRLFGSPVYGAGSGLSAQRNWNQVGYGWFGQNAPPYFTFGGYSPSEDWTLWSGVQLE